jgi:hypothetical protein
MTLVYSALSQVATIHSLTQDSYLFQVAILEFRMLALMKFRAFILPYLQQKPAVVQPLLGVWNTQDAELALAVCFDRRTVGNASTGVRFLAVAELV